LPVGWLDGISRLQGLANTIEDLAKRVVRHFAPPFLAGLGLWKLVPGKGHLHTHFLRRKGVPGHDGTNQEGISNRDFGPIHISILFYRFISLTNPLEEL
jgi:hypothetical protein